MGSFYAATRPCQRPFVGRQAQTPFVYALFSSCSSPAHPTSYNWAFGHRLATDVTADDGETSTAEIPSPSETTD